MDKFAAANRLNTSIAVQTASTTRVAGDAASGNGALFSQLLQNVDLSASQKPTPAQVRSDAGSAAQDQKDAAAQNAAQHDQADAAAAKTQADKASDKAQADKANARQQDKQDQADADDRHDAAAAKAADKNDKAADRAGNQTHTKAVRGKKADAADAQQDDTAPAADDIAQPVAADKPADTKTVKPVVAETAVDETATTDVPTADVTASATGAATPLPVLTPVAQQAAATPSSLPEAVEAAGKEGPAILNKAAGKAAAAINDGKLAPDMAPDAGDANDDIANLAATPAAATAKAPTTGASDAAAQAAMQAAAQNAAAAGADNKPAAKSTATQKADDTLKALRPLAALAGAQASTQTDVKADAQAAAVPTTMPPLTPLPTAPTLPGNNAQSLLNGNAALEAQAIQSADAGSNNGNAAAMAAMGRETTAATYDPASLRSGKAVTTATLANVVEQVSVQLNRAAKNGDKSFNVQLQPAELGRIEVKLDIGTDGKATATITADHQSTLDLMQKDSTTLTRALNDAGLQVDNNSLSFNLRDQNNNNGQSGTSQFGRQNADHSNANINARRGDTADDGTTLASSVTMNVAPGRVDIRA